MRKNIDLVDDQQIRRHLEAVVAVTKAFIQYDFDTMLQKVLTAISDMVSAKYGGIYLLDNRVVELAVEIGASEDLIRTVRHQVLPDIHVATSIPPMGLAAQTISHGKTIVLSKEEISLFTEEKRWSKYARKVVHNLGITDILSTPISSKGEHFGAIQLSRITNQPFSSHEIDLIESFAHELAMVLEIQVSRKETIEVREDLKFFIDLISHDISSQAMIIHSSLEELLSYIKDNHSEGKTDINFFMEASVQSIFRIQHIIDQVRLLNQVRLLSPEEIKPLNLNKSIRRAIIAIKSMYPKDEIQISVKKGEEQCWALGSELIDNCLINVLQNAVLADAHPEKKIEVNIAQDERHENDWRIEITDHGEGIPDEAKSKIFDRYFRARTRSQGSGLGLYLVRQILEPLGGTITLEDRIPEDYTKGARFILTLPRSAAGP